MPDKAGRQINVAGWAEESNFGIRLYTPSGSAGVNGTTDWEENVNELALQVCGLIHYSIILNSFFLGPTLVSNCCCLSEWHHPGNGRRDRKQRTSPT